ncbi:TetR/AcrR family transcriptional regulator [Shewanella psychromarinicola]|jgi:AcrR family transcriptional regulator|uniref:TetR/AcrR family transcriptional regulator n=2 Tax=Shewanellaceae TaxID=267890 RepID=A0A3N4EL84_9GAMM|nr:TetR/AcrR family transcriptional regulator [Shewanella psychromarinicola]RPA34341.1 TetR/AcrR family transcriptional regulator [Shewanella psychromarinicola]
MEFEMADKPGRPKGETQTRAALIDAAQGCFLHNSYDRVSIRELARRAGVDAAMIRYYFDSKAGLFETMVRETIAPVAIVFKHDVKNQKDSPEALMRAYYRMMERTPALPRLIFQSLNQQDSDEAFTIVSNVIHEMIGYAGDWIKELSDQQKLNPQLDPKWVRLSFISLMVFPLIAPKVLLKELDLPLSESMLDQLLAHNMLVMNQGLFQESSIRASGSGV